ncbi:mycofactocin system transcriptional regulator [Gordonia sp. CPCC 205333]
MPGNDQHVSPESRAAPVGRKRVTTMTHIAEVAIDLFARDGFDDTSVDDIAAAAGIARRTLFRYYSSKNAIAWGDFDIYLDELRALLDAIPAELPIADALQRALIDFNNVPGTELPRHRRRMALLLGVPALQAHSMLMYAEWRQVIAQFCARRLRVDATAPVPQTIAWMTLGTALAAYEQWLDSPDGDLNALLTEGSRILSEGVAALG